jgi:hypothetical protein
MPCCTVNDEQEGTDHRCTQDKEPRQSAESIDSGHEHIPKPLVIDPSLVAREAVGVSYGKVTQVKEIKTEADVSPYVGIRQAGRGPADEGYADCDSREPESL